MQAIQYCILVMLFLLCACAKESECKDSMCTVRAINLTASDIVGSWNGNPSDTIYSGDTLLLESPYNSIATFTADKISYSIRVNECHVDFPIF